ncbi:GNAT family N-acetyltransferase [Agromyces archimandritae]|uniref:GNAT family N-acetyltransferase n=1 Tax=Agromyces archimandritae TaxID=2781962 RepID=A0A975IPX8_9MICO|nr:GNAT family N-acetyltransferase [Agromyces archimandritae]QTX04461.1 GNAT family N-acetyltransferase [Agromyces archimandritae]
MAEIRPIEVPERLGTPESAPFEAFAALAESFKVETLGDADTSFGVDELFAFSRDQAYTERRRFGAWEGGRMIGTASVFWEVDGGVAAFCPTLGVVPEHRRRGIGSALLAAVEQAAASAGRTNLAVFGDHPIPDPDRPGERVLAPQGDAWLPADDPVVRFAREHGYRLGQLDRMSAMPLTGRAAEFAARLADSETASPDYRLVSWADAAPDELVDALAVAKEHMSVDAPSGAIGFEREVWDAARVRADERAAREAGRARFLTAAVAADGAIAGYTQLTNAPRKTVAYQDDTIVLAPYRGHGLGLRMKLANALALTRAAPERTRVITWNADENAHMLRINTALGFRPIALESSWAR